MSNSVRPHKQQPTRLPCPWDSPGKNTGVGCHFLFQCMKGKSESEVSQSSPTLCDPHGLQHTRLAYPSPTPRAYSKSCLLSWWCHPTISSSAIPFSSCLQSFPASGSFQMSQLFASCGQSIGVSALASDLPMKPRTSLLQNGLVGSPCSPRDSQESPTPQFKNINSSVLSFLYSPTLTTVRDYWKNHRFDYTDLS